MSTERMLCPEEQRARAEDPQFAEDLARIRSRAQEQRQTPSRQTPAVPYRDRPLTAFADLVGRVCQVSPEAVLHASPEAMSAPPQRAERSPAEWRIEQYIPERHREAVLAICPAPRDPTPALPEGQCKCPGGRRHYVPQNASQHAAFESVRNFCRATFRGEGPALILVGPTGVGKSHLLWAACRALNERNINAAGTSWKRLSDVIREAKAHPDDALRLRAIYERDRYLHARALCLDEIRATAGTDFDPTELSLIAVERHDHKRALLMSSQQRGEALTALADSASVGRLIVQELTGNNYRKPHEAQLRAL